MDLPFTTAMEQGLLRQNIAVSVIKKSAESDQLMAGILEKTLRSAPVSHARGANVNLHA